MELLKQLLATAKITIPDLETEVKALGFDPSNISEADAINIADKLKVSYTNKTLKPSKKQPLTVEVVTEKAAKANKSIIQTYQTLADKVVEHDANKILTIIESIPNATMERVRELLDDSEGNLDFFLNPVEDVQATFLSKFGVE